MVFECLEATLEELRSTVEKLKIKLHCLKIDVGDTAQDVVNLKDEVPELRHELQLAVETLTKRLEQQQTDDKLTREIVTSGLNELAEDVYHCKHVRRAMDKRGTYHKAPPNTLVSRVAGLIQLFILAAVVLFALVITKP